MATTKQKAIGAAWGALVGMGIWLAFRLKMPETPEWNWASISFFTLLGMAAGAWLRARFGPPDDTVIYVLRRRRRIVYIGIAYLRRAETRVREHRASGKRFDRVEWSRPMPRKRALQLEERKIRRHRPEYNVLHTT